MKFLDNPDEVLRDQLNDADRVMRAEALEVGGFWFPGGAKVRINCWRKPNWLQRTLMRVLLGFVWEDRK